MTIAILISLGITLLLKEINKKPILFNKIFLYDNGNNETKRIYRRGKKRIF